MPCEKERGKAAQSVVLTGGKTFKEGSYMRCETDHFGEDTSLTKAATCVAIVQGNLD